eukprot:s619_g6.t1
MHVSNVEAEAFKRCCAAAKPASVNLRSHVPTGPVGNALLMELPVARAALQRGVEEGLHYGAQLAVIFRGEAASLCVGEASEGRPLAEEAVLCWSSSVKPLMAVALGLLQERGRLSFEDPVAQHLPAFSKEGKADITLRHCLTHTAGLFASMMEGQPRLREDTPPDEVLRHICDQPTAEGWQLGRRCAYDSPAWYVMSGVVTAADPEHRAYEKFVEEEIFSPLGMSSCSIGIQPERRARLESSDLLAPLYLRGPKSPSWRLLPEEKNRRKVEYPCPAGNGRGPAKELAALYASLLPGAPAPLLQPETVEQITAVAREGIYDELQGVDTPWSLGFAVNCILSGRHASPKAFGHGGSQSSWAFADPEHGLAVCCLCNGGELSA